MVIKNKNKNYPNLKVMETFTEKNLPDLTTTVLGALELFSKEGLPKVKIPKYKKPIVFGSGNAKVTGNILFGNSEAVFADETNFKEVVKRKGIDGAIIFSASGEKHAPIAAKYFLSKKIKTTLVTCNPDSSAGKVVGEKNTVVTARNREPYTYNTSTYMGWILANTRENPDKILEFIKTKVKPKIPNSIANYNGYLLVTPDSFERGNTLFEVKFIELFARRVARDVKTFEELKHAITVVPYEKELCIQFGEGQDFIFHGDVFKVPLPKDAGIATIMAIGYYVIGNIVAGKPQYFKKNIGKFIAELSSTKFGKGLKVIVE